MCCDSWGCKESDKTEHRDAGIGWRDKTRGCAAKTPELDPGLAITMTSGDSDSPVMSFPHQ